MAKPGILICRMLMVTPPETRHWTLGVRAAAAAALVLTMIGIKPTSAIRSPSCGASGCPPISVSGLPSCSPHWMMRARLRLVIIRKMINLPTFVGIWGPAWHTPCIQAGGSGLGWRWRGRAFMEIAPKTAVKPSTVIMDWRLSRQLSTTPFTVELGGRSCISNIVSAVLDCSELSWMQAPREIIR